MCFPVLLFLIYASGVLVLGFLKSHAKSTMLEVLPASSDILCTHPMFGPESGRQGWQGLPFLYERVRVTDAARCEPCIRYRCYCILSRCKMQT